MSREIEIRVSDKDDYLLKTIMGTRQLRTFNNRLRGVSIPVGDFHSKMHEQVIYDVSSNDTNLISHLSNIFSVSEPRYKALVLEIRYCDIKKCHLALMDWYDKSEAPDELRITAVMKGNRCLRVLQFGVE